MRHQNITLLLVSIFVGVVFAGLYILSGSPSQVAMLQCDSFVKQSFSQWFCGVLYSPCLQLVELVLQLINGEGSSICGG